MSGGGSNTFPGFGSTSGGGVGGVKGNVDYCLSINDQTILNSPVPDVIKNLKKGDELTIEEENKILYAKKDGEIAGTITSPKAIHFIECIAHKYEYIGIVESVAGGRCEVTIRVKA